MFKKKTSEAVKEESEPHAVEEMVTEVETAKDEKETVEETAETDQAPDLDTVLLNHEQRLQQLEAAFFRLKNSL